MNLASRPRAVAHRLMLLRWAAAWCLVLMLALPGSAPAQAAGRERTGGLEAFVLLDESGSMKPIFGRVTGFLAGALVRDYLEPGDYLCVIGFADTPHVRLSQRLTSPAEKANVAEIVRSLNVTPAGHTDMGRALEETLTQLERLAAPTHQQALLIVTDGLNQPPRDSPFFAPVRPDTGGPVAPPSSFGPRFRAVVARLAAAGHRVHVVGLGTETDAAGLAEALGAGHTILATFDPEALRRGLGRFWDETIDLVRLEAPSTPWRAGSTVPLTVRLRSSDERSREIEVRGARLEHLAALVGRETAVAPEAFGVALATNRWVIAARHEASFELTLAVPQTLPAGDYRATLSFDLASAVRFYPPQADVAFHVPSFWELHGRTVIAAVIVVCALIVGLLLYRRRAITVALVVEGDDATRPARPVRFPIGATGTFGGGATDRFQLAGLPQKIAVLERRTVERFALISTRPEIVPTLPEYHLGEALTVRLGNAPEDQRTVRFVRARRRSAAPRRETPRPARPRRGGDAQATPGGIDFR